MSVIKFKEREPVGSLSYRVKRESINDIKRQFSKIKLKTEPRDHQYRALCLGVLRDHYLFALDMGLGKTKIALDLMTVCKAMGWVSNTLVTCPPTVILQWRREVLKHSDLSCAIVEGKDFKEKFWMLKNLSAKRDITVVSHAWLVRVFSQMNKSIRFMRECKEIFSRFGMIVVDEAHGIRNISTVGFKGYKSYLGGIPRKYLLTGTPIGNSYTSVYGLYRFMDNGVTFGTNYAKFLRYYFYEVFVRRWGGPKYSIRTNMREKFFRKFWSSAVRWEENECLDLPDKIHTAIPIKMSDKQLIDYNQVLEDGADGATYKLMYVTADVDNNNSIKIKTLLELINLICVEGGKKLVIWAWLTSESDKILEAIKKNFKLKVGRIYGKTSASDKQTILNKWSAEKLDILLSNQRSCGVGVDLYQANHMIFFSNSYSANDRAQSEKRIHRMGQNRTCYYYDLVVEDSVDQVILDVIKNVRKDTGQFNKDSALYNKSRKIVGLDMKLNKDKQ